MGIFGPDINTRFPRSLLMGTIGGSFYLACVYSLYRGDRKRATFQAELERREAFYATDEGKAQLALAREFEAEQQALEREHRELLAQTQEGREQLSRDRRASLEDLRYRETKLQYEIAKLDADIFRTKASLETQLKAEFAKRQRPADRGPIVEPKEGPLTGFALIQQRLFGPTGGNTTP